MAKSILIIDDDPIIVKYLQNLLEDNGYEARSAADSAAAQAALAEKKPDLITLDLAMPDEWGTRFYRKISKNPEYADIPVIVISGMQGRHLSIKKAVAHLPKPFDADKLIGIIRGAIGG